MLCYGENLTITNRSKGPITSYNWSFGNAIPSSHAGAAPPVLNFPNGGTYSLRLIVTNGSCQDTMEKTITVVQIMPNAGKDTFNCLGAFTVQLGESAISDWSYSWTPSKFLNDPNIADPICNIVNDSVNYILEITDRSSGCMAYDTVVVYTNRNIASKTTKQRICFGDSILFNNNYSKTTNLYYYTIKKTDGICDSFIDVLDLNVLQKQVFIYTPKIHCDFYIDGKGKQHDTSYIEQDTIRSKSLLNCDSIINITPREIFKKIYKEKTVQGCSPFLYNGKTYITSKAKDDSIRIRGAYSGCDSIIEYINVIVYPTPKAEITPSIPNPVMYKQTVTLTASGGQTYLWLQTGSTNSEIDYKLNQIQPRLFTVRVTDDYNCWDTVSYIVNGELPDTCYYGFPNAFTPNQDGLNDEYIPNMDECAEIKVFAIYDRWGEKVFETNQLKGWNGVYKGKPAPKAVYLYYAELITPWGIKIHKGTFILIR
jgi:gliding motility-associated-like protein